jgi:protein-L-isoaspartate(D-aspartate) O-methyltransferase
METMGKVRAMNSYLPTRSAMRMKTGRFQSLWTNDFPALHRGLMTDLLNVNPDAVVLEVGTGSGYQAAVLAELVKAVYTIEIIPALGEQARKRLEAPGCHNVEVRLGDGYYGWEEHAPYDGIIVTAAASHVPPPLIRQLKPGGKMVIPVGGPFMTQELMLIEKGSDEKITTRQLLPVAFVPLTGKH